jgi:hypothetical protein
MAAAGIGVPARRLPRRSDPDAAPGLAQLA